MKKEAKCELTHDMVKQILVKHLCKQNPTLIDEDKIGKTKMIIEELKFIISIEQQ